MNSMGLDGYFSCATAAEAVIALHEVAAAITTARLPVRMSVSPPSQCQLFLRARPPPWCGGEILRKRGVCLPHCPSAAISGTGPAIRVFTAMKCALHYQSHVWKR